jgi:hypothetical protein
MDDCTHCHAPLDGPRLTDRETGRAFHPECAAALVRDDLAAALLAFAVALLVPMAVVWAG